ncbi:hypothetical protein LXL04_005415 [Taraxacum kok-saghyz]
MSSELAIGGGGGNIGKSINFGGGDGGDDDGDDDDYFDDFDDGDEGDDGGLFRRRIILPELYDRKFLEAVLNEWEKTMMDLPSGLCQAYEMIYCNQCKANNRKVHIAFTSSIIMIADPAFLYPIFLEQAATIGSSVLYENRIKEDWDLALINVLTVTACNAMLSNEGIRHAEKTPFLFYKAAELCMVGLIAGAVQGGLSNLVASKKEGRLSVTIPSVSTNALGYGVFLGIYANLRYQLLSGFDTGMVT